MARTKFFDKMTPKQRSKHMSQVGKQVKNRYFTLNPEAAKAAANKRWKNVPPEK